MIDGAVTLALLAGLVAAFNPCGFAMLPAYVGYFVGRDDSGGETASIRVLRSIPVALAVSAGFVVVFGAIGFVLGAINESWESEIQRNSPYLTIVIGPLLALLGIAMLLGKEFAFRGPKLSVGGGDRGLKSMFLFGVSYAVASISCTFPIFAGTVVSAGTREGTVTGVMTVLAYGIGMSLIITALTLAVALAREPIVRFMRSGMQYVNRASGVLMIVIGAYVTWYGVFALRVRDDPTAAGGPVDWVDSWSVSIENRIQEIGEGWVAGVLLAFVAVVAAVALAASRRRRAVTSPADIDDSASSPVPESVS